MLKVIKIYAALFPLFIVSFSQASSFMVNYHDLIANSEKYNGKEIMVDGYLCNIGSQFYLSAYLDGCLRSSHANEILLDLTRDVIISHEENGSGGEVSVQGEFISQDERVTSGEYISTGGLVGGYVRNANILNKYGLPSKPELNIYNVIDKDITSSMDKIIEGFKYFLSEEAKSYSQIREYFGKDQYIIDGFDIDGAFSADRLAFVVYNARHNFVKSKFSSRYYFQGVLDEEIKEHFLDRQSYLLCECNQPVCDLAEKGEASINDMLRGKMQVCYTFFSDGGEIKLFYSQFAEL